MIVLYIGGICAIISLICAIQSNQTVVSSCGYSMAGGGIGIVMSLLIILMFCPLLPIEPQFKTIHNLRAIQDSTAIKGSFMLGSGNIQDTMYYFFYRKIKKNTFQFGKIEAQKSIIIDNEDGNPRIEVYQDNFKNEWARNWLILPSSFRKKSYRIFIPSNSIKQNFTLDLK